MENYNEKTEIELLKKELSQLKEDSSKREKELLNQVNEASKREKEAINKALSIAKDNDIVLVAGKGRDNYMAIEDKYLPYNDYDEITSFFEKD